MVMWYANRLSTTNGMKLESLALSRLEASIAGGLRGLMVDLLHRRRLILVLGESLVTLGY